jgi:hypothetical protein
MTNADDLYATMIQEGTITREAALLKQSDRATGAAAWRPVRFGRCSVSCFVHAVLTTRLSTQEMYIILDMIVGGLDGINTRSCS